MDAEHLTDQFSIRAGAVRLRDLGYLLAGDDELDEDEVAHTAVFEWDPHAGWGGHDLGWTASAACICDEPKEQLVVVGRLGEFLVFGQGESYEGVIPCKPTPSGDPAPFRGARGIAGKAYAVGMNSQVFRRDSRTVWTPLDNGLDPRTDLEAIDGFEADDLYAVGWKGAIWHYNGRRWSDVDSLTNVILTGVSCAGDGQVYACGQEGTLLRGVGNRWEVIEQEETREDFWDVEWFGNEIYVSTTRFLYRLSGRELRLVNFGRDAPKTCYHLSSRDSVLWSIGQRDVMAFDGKNWSRIT
jgi:hypothetical protein